MSEKKTMNENPFERLFPTGSNYPRLPLLHAFNWAECLADQPPREWYVVAFRSIRNVEANPVYLKMLDDLAYEEAMREPGLLLYFRGSLTADRECLSICVWESQTHALEATRHAAHQAAADITDEMYDVFELERWRLVKHATEPRLELVPVPWHGPPPAQRRRSAVPLGMSRFVDLDSIVMSIPVPRNSGADRAQ